ncbi:PrsW family intramembrane metalloprotease [Glycomyces buryatensis]|uniref:PrsW family intramembrane metalloprotease n=1 Tax=Glycomyces buryatensis TaxID=2570927 RepID=A0A4S8Q2Y5_9ACTN|nr:PrsW family intramembrane metalloprotease [Glycomyces buryatensis]THV38557.1 PrsW family intramembrane metalloprotease [Glycomyces buryatensis]
MSVPTERLVVESQGAFIRVRRPAYWLYCACLVYGLIGLGRVLSPDYADIASALWASVAINGILAIIFLTILARLDLFEREPVTVRAAAMCWGGLAAVAFAMTANDSALVVLAELHDAEWARTWGPAIAGPLNEEWLKALGVVLLVLIVREHFDRPIDGLIYGALVGLGFQVVENLTYAINFAVLNPNSSLVGSLSVTFSRVLVAGPWSHPLYTGTAGLGIAYLVTQSRRSMRNRLSVAAGLFVLAMAMHALWNLPFPPELSPLVSIPLMYGKGLIILALFFVLYHLAARAEWNWFVTTMSDQDEEVITTDDLTSMRTLRSRKRARNAAASRWGKRAAHLTGQLQRELVKLAALVARDQRRGDDDDEDPLDVAAVKRNIAAIRAELAQVETEQSSVGATKLRLPAATGVLRNQPNRRLTGGPPDRANRLAPEGL